MIPVQLIIAAVIAAVSFATAWTYQGNHYERVIAEQRAAQSALLAEAYANAKRETERMAQAKDAALKQASIRQAALSRDLAANRAGLVGLSHATDQALRAAEHSHSSCKSNAAALADVFAGCTGQLVNLGEAADGWRSEALTLREAWPTSAQP